MGGVTCAVSKRGLQDSEQEEHATKKSKLHAANDGKGQQVLANSSGSRNEAALNHSQVYTRDPPAPCQPLGNLLVQQHARNARNPGLGRMAVLPDEILVSIFTELEALDLVRLQGVSHAFYSFTRIEGQWKHEYIKRKNGKLEGWRGSWRRTYLQQFCPKLLHLPYLPTDTLRICDIYSDVLFTPYMAARYDPRLLVKSSKFADNIPHIDGSSLETDALGDKPLILTNLMDHWPALKNGGRPWSLQKLSHRYPDVQFRAEAVLTRLSEYIPYHDHCPNDESPLYIFDADFVEKTNAAQPGQGLGTDFSVPDLFQDDLFSILGDMRPDYRWLIAGPARSGSTFHCDPNATSAWNAVVTGKKLWILFPPHIAPPGVTVSEDQAEVEAPLSLAEWLSNFYGDAKRQYGPFASDPKCRDVMLEGVCNAGELFYVPSGWWHLVVNLEDSIAVTQNFVSRTNLKQVLQFLKHRPDQVSGFAPNQGVAGEDESGGGTISDIFEAALSSREPDLYQAAVISMHRDGPAVPAAPSHSEAQAPFRSSSTNVWKSLNDAGSGAGEPVSDAFTFDFDYDNL